MPLANSTTRMPSSGPIHPSMRRRLPQKSEPQSITTLSAPRSQLANSPDAGLPRSAGGRLTRQERPNATMFRRLLIANRGEIAVRIARAASTLGIETVGVCSEDDEGTLFTRKVDDVRVLNGRGVAAYLDQKQI